MLNPLIPNQLVNNPSGLPQAIPPAATSIAPATTLPTTMPHTVAPPQIASKFPALPFPASASAPTVPSPQTSLLSNPVVQAALSRALNPNAAVAPGPRPPPTMSELTRKYGLWKGFAEKIQQDPAFMQGLLTFGATMMSPHAPGTPAFANLGPAIMGAEKSYNSTNAIIAKSLQARQALGLAAANTQVKGAAAAGAIIKDAGGVPPKFQFLTVTGKGPDGNPVVHVLKAQTSGTGAGGRPVNVANYGKTLKPLPTKVGGEIQGIISFDQTLHALQYLSKNYGKKIAGPWLGRINDILFKAGLPTTNVAADAYNVLMEHGIIYLTSLGSGTRMSVPMIKLFEKVLPGIAGNKAKRTALMDYSEALLASYSQGLTSQYLGTGYKIPARVIAIAKRAMAPGALTGPNARRNMELLLPGIKFSPIGKTRKAAGASYNINQMSNTRRNSYLNSYTATDLRKFTPAQRQAFLNAVKKYNVSLSPAIQSILNNWNK